MQDAEEHGELTWPGSERWKLQPWARTLNTLLRKFRLPVAFQHAFDDREDMVTLEQAANLHLLLAGVIQTKVSGAVVELGCYAGSTSVVIASLMKRLDPRRRFHVFDSFEHELGNLRNIRSEFESNMRKLGTRSQQIHEGDLFDTIPSQLPDEIAFAHIDLGIGGDPVAHSSVITHALDSIYPKLQQNAIVVLMDYHVPGQTINGHDANPGVRLACDQFFLHRPEAVTTLYGGAYSHGYFRKH